MTNPKLNSLVTPSEETESIIHVWSNDIGVGISTFFFAASLSKLSQGKKVIYISTKSLFKTERFQQLMQFYTPFDPYNFLLYHPTSFAQQIEIIMNLEFLILEELRLLKKSSIGLIVLDGASILRHLELKSEEHNQKSLRVYNTTIATLEFIRTTYLIPILISNRAVIRIKDDKIISQPASNIVMEYWTKIRIKLERTDTPSLRNIKLEKHPTAQNLPIQIQTELTESGFI
ncbi:MAG: hypothetical protein JW776_14790 [Candidatus Lokiarchaeota archaeon]|nr:hypothetical protein [Candidatus Lokiarchaeota archaeon]